MTPKPRRTYIAQKVRTFVWANADKPLTAEFIAKELDAVPSSVSHVLASMIEDFPDQMERIRKGLYRWNSNGVAPKENEPDTDMIVEIIGKRDGRTLVRAEDGALYVMQPFEF